MKKDIHPDYHPVIFQDAGTGRQFLTRSTATSDRTVQWEDGNEYPLIVDHQNFQAIYYGQFRLHMRKAGHRNRDDRLLAIEFWHRA